MANIKQTLDELMTLDGAMCAAVVDSASGMMLGSAGSVVDLEVAAAGNTEVIRSKMKTMRSLGLNDVIEDILITLGKQYHIGLREQRRRVVRAPAAERGGDAVPRRADKSSQNRNTSRGQHGIHLRDERGQDVPIDVGAHLVWSAAANTPGQAFAGLRFLTIDREPLERLRQWVNAGPEAE